MELISIIQGDEKVLKFIVTDIDSGAPINITGWEIYCQINNDRGSGAAVTPIKKATVGIPDGADDQIDITDGAGIKGIFVIYLSITDTKDMEGAAQIEIWRAKDAVKYRRETSIAKGNIEFIKRIADIRTIITE